MRKTKMIIASVAAVGIMALGGASYVNANGASNEESDAIELVKKKKHRHNSFYQRQHDYNRQNNDRQQYNNSGARYDENIMLPAMRNIQGCVLLRRKAYTVLYDTGKRIPLWVAWHLTKQHTYGGNSRKEMQFQEDESVKRPRATNFDYMSSGYDRGHMCPAGDNKWDRQALRETFLFTNCCPQLHSLNSGDWNDLEIQCREWARRYGDIYIVCGPVFMNRQHRTIGKNRVVVPEAFFKVVLCMNGTPRAVGFIYRNEGGRHKMMSYVNSVDEVERITGFDFFAALPDNIERRVEANADFRNF